MSGYLSWSWQNGGGWSQVLSGREINGHEHVIGTHVDAFLKVSQERQREGRFVQGVNKVEEHLPVLVFWMVETLGCLQQ